MPLLEPMSYPGCAVRFRDQDGLVVGAGVLVSGRHVLTCAHVVADALGRSPPPNKPPTEFVVVDVPPFDDAARKGLRAQVVAWRPVGAAVGPSDVAVLALDLPEGVSLSGGIGPGDVERKPPVRGTRLRCWGYPSGHDAGLEADVVARDPDGAGTIHIEPDVASARFVEGGYSGGPVVMEEPSGRLRLVGISVRKLDTDGVRRGFVIPAQDLCRVWPPLAQPYRGLEAFQEGDADLFFGRDAAVAELKARLAGRPFVTVLGTSGAGKSSVVRAGLAHALRAEGWVVATCRPDADPALDLWAALAPILGAEGAVDPAARTHPARDPADLLARARRFRETAGVRGTLVILDQFEQLFTLEPEKRAGATAEPLDAEEARLRLDYGTVRQRDFVRLLEAIGHQDPREPPLVAVATLRADFLGPALGIGALKRLLAEGDVKLGPMGADELAAAIGEPAARFGAVVEDRLVARMVVDMARQPGGLPFLEVALEGLWAGQKVPTQAGPFDWELRRDDYAGLDTAIDAFADGALARLSAPLQLGADAEARVRRVMMRLVRLGDGDGEPDARAIVTRAEIGEEGWPVAQALARERLLALGARAKAGAEGAETEETAEIAHEALLTGWKKLAGWTRSDRDFGRWRQRLAVYLGSWSGEPQDADLPAPQLGETTSWLERRREDLNQNECAFIKAARENAEREAARLKSRLRLLVLAVVLLVAALGTTSYFYNDSRTQTAEALRQKTEADTQTQIARDQTALANTSAKQEAEARKRAVTEAEHAKKEAMRAEGRRLATEAEAANRPDGAAQDVAAALSVEAWRKLPTSQAYRAASRAWSVLPVVRVKFEQGASVVAVSPDGTLLASAGYDGTARVTRISDGMELLRVPHKGVVSAIAFSRDGTLLASAGADGMARVTRIEDGVEIARVDHGSEAIAVAFNPDGTLLASAGDDGTARVTRIADGVEVARVTHDATVDAVAFGPDGKLLASAGWDGTARVTRIADGVEVARVEHVNSARGVEFSPDGTLIASGGTDGMARVTRIADGVEVARVDHVSPVNAVAFSPDGTMLASAGDDGTAGITRIADGVELVRVLHDSTVNDVAFSPDGTLLASAGNDQTARVTRISDVVEIARFVQSAQVLDVAFSPDGALLASASVDGSAQLRRIGGGAEIVRSVHRDSVVVIDFSLDGTMLASAGYEATAQVTRIADGAEIARVRLCESGANVVVAFSPEMTQLACASYDGHVRVNRIADNLQVARIAHDDVVSAVAFSPDGLLLASGGKDQTVQITRIADGTQVNKFLTDHWVNSLAFSSSGELIAYLSSDGTVRIMLTANGLEVARLAYETAVADIAFSPDGKLLACVGIDGTIRIVRVADKVEVARIAHDDVDNAVAISPDGTLLASASSDGTARLTRIADRVEIARVEYESGATSVAFSPNGQFWASGGADGIVRVLPMPDAVVEGLCTKRAGRNLNADEWVRYMGPIEEWAPTCLQWESDPELVDAWNARRRPL